MGAMILPLSNALEARSEALVLVVPRPDEVYRSPNDRGGTRDWNSSVFHQAMVRSIQRLADPIKTPWLAKVVLVVTPTMSGGGSGNSGPSLDQTVSSFLDA